MYLDRSYMPRGSSDRRMAAELELPGWEVSMEEYNQDKETLLQRMSATEYEELRQEIQVMFVFVALIESEMKDYIGDKENNK